MVDNRRFLSIVWNNKQLIIINPFTYYFFHNEYINIDQIIMYELIRDLIILCFELQFKTVLFYS